MQKVLFILGVLAGLLLFSSQQQEEKEDACFLTYARVVTENSVHDFEHQLVVISNDLKSSNCLTPRRAAQSIHSIFNVHVYKHTERFLRSIRIKETEELQHVCESVSSYQTSMFNALLSCMGYRIYALRKIII